MNSKFVNLLRQIINEISTYLLKERKKSAAYLISGAAYTDLIAESFPNSAGIVPDILPKFVISLSQRNNE